MQGVECWVHVCVQHTTLVVWLLCCVLDGGLLQTS